MIHIGLQIGVDHGLVRFREQAQMNALRLLREVSYHQILINVFRHERDKRSGDLAQGDEAGVQRHVGADLVLLHSLRPETFTAAADIPVAQIIHKLLQGTAGFRDLVIGHAVVHRLDQGVQLG